MLKNYQSCKNFYENDESLQINVAAENGLIITELINQYVRHYIRTLII